MTPKEAKERKVCFRCKTPTDGTRARCPECARADSQREIARQKERQKNGLCINCKTPTGGAYRCTRCSQRHTATTIKRQKALLAQGLCKQCSGPRTHSAQLCEQCQRGYREYCRVWRKQQRRATSTP